MSKGKVIGGSVLSILALVVAQILAELLASAFLLVALPEAICNIIAGILYVVLAFFLLRLVLEKALKLSLKDLGITKPGIKPVWVATAFLLPAVVKLIYLLIFKGTYVSSDMDTSTMLVRLSAGIMFSGFGAGIVEEMVFRGVIFNLLKKWNTKVAVILPSLLFGLVHIIGMDFSIGSCLLVIIAGTMVGVMFSVIAIESGSIWNGALVHTLWNIIIIGGGLAIGEAADEYSAMTYVLTSKLFAVTGGEFGIESSAIAVIGYTLVTCLAIALIKKKSLKK